jgi:predicted dehydrogenase
MSRMVEVGIIGYRNHASKLASLIENNPNCKLKVIFHPSKNIEDKRGTNDFTELYSCDGVIISSPNNTHFEYLDKLIENFDGYIFCEKPPVTSNQELEKLRNLSIQNKQRIFFNFNLRFSELNESIKQIKNSDDIGKIIHVNIIIAHGFAFKDKYRNSWRSDSERNLHNILETLAIHYIDLLKWNFGEIERYSYFPTLNSKVGSSYDTSHTSLMFKNGINSSIFTSYSSPSINEITIVGTNGFCMIRDNTMKVFSPRDTFDSNGLFMEPPLKFETDYYLNEKFQESIANSMDYFLSNMQNNKKIDTRQYDESLSTNQLVFKLTGRNSNSV